jgi:hypothetical protein
MEYPSRSNLNCFPEFYGAPAEGDALPLIRFSLSTTSTEKATIFSWSEGIRTPMPLGLDLQSSEPAKCSTLQ